MTWKFSYRPEVAEDLAHTINWYKDKRDGLGIEFLDEYLQAIAIIRERPLSFAVAAMVFGPAVSNDSHS